MAEGASILALSASMSAILFFVMSNFCSCSSSECRAIRFLKGEDVDGFVPLLSSFSGMKNQNTSPPCGGAVQPRRGAVFGKKKKEKKKKLCFSGYSSFIKFVRANNDKRKEELIWVAVTPFLHLLKLGSLGSLCRCSGLQRLCFPLWCVASRWVVELIWW